MSMGRISEVEEDGLEGEIVGAGAKAADASEREVGEERAATKVLPRLGFAQVHFDEGKAGGEEGVAQGNARVSEAPGVEDARGGFGWAVGVEEIDDFSLVIALHGEQPVTALTGAVFEPRAERGEILPPVKGRFATPEEIEIRAVDKEDGGHEGGGRMIFCIKCPSNASILHDQDHFVTILVLRASVDA
jgi:hypothetical protein